MLIECKTADTKVDSWEILTRIILIDTTVVKIRSGQTSKPEKTGKNKVDGMQSKALKWEKI